MPTKYKRSDIKFVNPYTFIPTPKGQQVNRSGLESAQAASLHTGFLQCRLYVRTPLGIPDAENVEEVKIIKESKEKKEEPEKVHKKYPFFSYEKNEKGKPIPAIPGSSLRGPIRSVFEAATDSCFSTLREDTGLSKRMDSYGAYMPGILKWVDGEWKLYQAKRYLLAVDPFPVDKSKGYVDRNYSKYPVLPGDEDVYVNIFKKGDDGPRVARTQTGEELYFGDMVEFDAYTKGRGRYMRGTHVIWEGIARNIKKSEDSITVGGKLRGLVYIGETFGKKKHGESIFLCEKEVKDFNEEELKKAYKDLLKTLEIYRDTGVNKTKSHNGYRGFENAKKENGIPVWYSVEDAKLSMAAIGRTFYKTTLNDLVGDRKPCASRKKLCEACALFGMAGEESLGSRIRFTDAKVEGRYDLQYETLQILGQPRHSYLPFYARKNGAVAKSYDDEEVEIAGRKFYWHNEKAAKPSGSDVYSTNEKTEMNSTLELVMPRAEFVFNVYYDGITEDQLEKLMWCLNFGENRKDGDLCHKLGHGKPLGLGSVKIIIEEKAERVFADGTYEWKHEKPAESQADPNLRNLKGIKRVMDFRWLTKGPDKNLKIMYPDVYDEHGGELPAKRRNDEARHVWYMENRKKPCPANNFDLIEVLPNILAENQTLHAYQKEVGESHENGGEREDNDFRQGRGDYQNHRGNNNSKNSHEYNKKREGKR